MKPAQIAPSLLAADYAHIADEIARVEEHSDWLHLDVMDGHFVPNLSYGMPVIAAVRAVTKLPFDVHLMTTNPDAYLSELAVAGADRVVAHIEALPDPTAAAAKARAEGLSFGLAVSPDTPLAALTPFAELCDEILVMTVEPGHGGQSFITAMLPKIAEARNFIDSEGLAADIEVDGGITPESARAARDAGAEVFVAGTSVFRSPDPVRAIAAIRDAVRDVN